MLRFFSRRRLLAGVGAAVLVAAAGGAWVLGSQRSTPLLLAPMIGGLDGCLFVGSEGAPAMAPAFETSCRQPAGSAAALVEGALAPLQTVRGRGRGGDFELGYTLHVPLLKLFKRDGGAWAVDSTAVQRVVQTVQGVDRPVIVYLFSNHFSVGGPLEQALAAEPDNLLVSNTGRTLPVDSYYGAPLYPWSFTNHGNGITRHRAAAVQAVLGALCQMPPAAVARVRGVTLLGELHHMFPRFESGMGYDAAYAVTDYSDHSQRGFRQFLEARFGSVSALNAALGSSYATFQQVKAPSKDIRRDPLERFEDHIDAFAQGSFPVSGWVRRPGATGSPWVRVLANGVLVGRARAAYARRDVLAAHPEWGSADLGFQLAVDYRAWQPGVHRIDVLLETDGAPVLLGSRSLSVMSRTQATPQPVALTQALPEFGSPPDGLKSHLDQPIDLAAVYFNPLVPWWHVFRATQVSDYLQHFGAMVGTSCLGADRAYAHQIFPDANPGWDPSRFGIGPTLGVPASLQLGVSLYGEASYGKSFSDWLRAADRPRYGLTEFHPLVPMDAPTLRALLLRHKAQGAQFVSFFSEVSGVGERNSAVANPFVFAPGNADHGSDVLFQSTVQLLR